MPFPDTFFEGAGHSARNSERSAQTSRAGVQARSLASAADKGGLTPKALPRGLRHYEGAAPRVLAGVLSMGALSLYLWWQDPWLLAGWAVLFEAFAAFLGWGSVTLAVSSADGVAATLSGAPGAATGAYTSITALMGAFGLVVLSVLMNKESVPQRYGLRAIALILGTPALGYFVLGIDPQLDVASHVSQLFRIGYWLLLVMPVLYALTGMVLPGNVFRRSAWVLLALLYTYITIPVLGALHMTVLSLLGFAWAPLLNLLLGVLLLSVHVICFYGLIAATSE